MKYIGIIPAAGLGNRLQPLPFSKEMYPFGYQTINGQKRICPVSLHLVNSLKEAGVSQLYFVINSHKMDIPRYYSNGSQFSMNISYLIQPEQKGLVDSLAQATPWISENDDTLIFFGMPDTFFQPANLFNQLKQKMLDRDCQVMLGLFPTQSWWKLAMVRIAENPECVGEIIDILEKPKIKPDTDYAWGVAVWRPLFQHYLSQHLAKYTGKKEHVLSEVFMSAKADGMKIGYVIGDEYTDIGTIDELVSAVTKLHLRLNDTEKEV